MYTLDDDIVEIVDAQAYNLSDNEDITPSEARQTARQNVRRASSRYLDDPDSLFDDIEDDYQ